MGLSQKRHKPHLFELRSAKVNPALRTKDFPNASLVRKATLAYFSPSLLLPLGPRWLWASSGSVGTAAWVVASCSGNQLQTCSPLGRRLIGHEKAFLHSPQQPKLSQLRRDSTRANLSNGTKLASRSCILQRETLLGEHTTFPIRPSSGKQCLPISHLALCYP